MDKRKRDEGILFLIILIVGIPITIILFHLDNKQWEQCHKETKGKLNGFRLYSNKMLEIEIEYFINDVKYETYVSCDDRLRNLHISNHDERVIGKPCTVYYACDNYRNIRFNYEKDSIK